MWEKKVKGPETEREDGKKVKRGWSFMGHENFFVCPEHGQSTNATKKMVKEQGLFLQDP